MLHIVHYSNMELESKLNVHIYYLKSNHLIYKDTILYRIFPTYYLSVRKQQISSKNQAVGDRIAWYDIIKFDFFSSTSVSVKY